MWCSGSYEHICLRGRGFESPWGLVFILILARREMYVGMGMSFVGEGRMRMGMGMSFVGEGRMRKEMGRGESKMQNRNGNGSLPLTALISSIDVRT
jgi:hypothetical protein